MNNTDLLAENQRLQQRIQELEAKAYTDPLTGCPNRHSYLERRSSLTSEATWVYVDICYLKKINDAHGHAAGDVAIAETAKAIRRHTATPITLVKDVVCSSKKLSVQVQFLVQRSILFPEPGSEPCFIRYQGMTRLESG